MEKSSKVPQWLILGNMENNCYDIVCKLRVQSSQQMGRKESEAYEARFEFWLYHLNSLCDYKQFTLNFSEHWILLF